MDITLGRGCLERNGTYIRGVLEPRGQDSCRSRYPRELLQLELLSRFTLSFGSNGAECEARARGEQSLRGPSDPALRDAFYASAFSPRHNSNEIQRLPRVTIAEMPLTSPPPVGG